MARRGETTCRRLVSALQAARFTCPAAELGAAVVRLLDGLGIGYRLPSQRPSWLSAPDLLLSGGIVLVLHGSDVPLLGIWPELLRYAAHDDVRAIVVAFAQAALPLPDSAEGKPLHHVRLMRC